MAVPRPEFAAFLRSRRDAITPAQAGMRAFPGPRRVPGLRREELALLAGLSPDYYSRLEQGRQDQVSVEVLGALARALRLDDVETAHLHDLAGPRRRPVASGGAVGGVAPQRPDPGLLRVMAALDHLPALVLGRRTEILARNALLVTVLGADLPPGTSFGRWLLQEPLARTRILNWEAFARNAVATLRRETGRHPEDTLLARQIVALRVDPDIDRWWNDHLVRDYASTVKRVAHPQAGNLEFDVEQLTAPLDPDQHLVVYTAQPDSPTAKVLPLLRSWAAPVDVR